MDSESLFPLLTKEGPGEVPPPSIFSRFSQCLPLLLITLSAILIRIPSLFLPMNRDSGTFAYGGWRILAGQLPYTGFWDNKPPGVFYINALAVKLFGATPIGLVVFQMIYGAACALLFYVIARKLFSLRTALITSLLFAFYHGGYGLNEEGNFTESYLALPVLLSVFLILRWSVRGRRGWFLPFTAGVLGTAAFLIKQPGLAIVPAIAFFLIISDRKNGWRSALAVIAGALTAFAVTIGWMAHKGILAGAIEANVTFNRLYSFDAYTNNFPTVFWNLLRGLTISALPLAGAIVGIVRIAGRKSFTTEDAGIQHIGMRNKVQAQNLTPQNHILDSADDTPLSAGVEGRLLDSSQTVSPSLPAERGPGGEVFSTLAFLLLWFILDLVGIAAGGRFYTHYFLAILPSALLLTGVFIDSLKSHKAVVVSILAGLVLFFGPVWSVQGFLPERKTFPVSSAVEREYYAVRWVIVRRLGQGIKLPAEEVADWVKANTLPMDTIYVWGYDPRIAFLSQRPFPSRYIHIHPLGVTGFDRDRRIKELARDLESNRPVYIIDESYLPQMRTTAPPLDPRAPLPPVSQQQFFRLDGYEPVQKVVSRLYEPVEMVGGCGIYGLK